MSFSESGSLGNSSGSDVTSLSSQLPDTPNSMVPSPVDTWGGLEVSCGPPHTHPPSAHPRPLQGRAETSVTFNQEKRTKDLNGLYARGYIQVPTGGLEIWLFPLHLSILAHCLFCSRTPRQDTPLLMDIMGLLPRCQCLNWPQSAEYVMGFKHVSLHWKLMQTVSNVYRKLRIQTV